MKRKIRSKKAEKCLHKERVILVMLLSAVLLFFLASSPNFGTKTIVDSVDYFNQVSLFDGSSITGAAVIGISSTDNDDDLGTFVDDFADGISNTSRWFNHTTRMTIHHENELMRFNASLASTEGNASIITIENLSMHSFNITANVTLQNTSDSLSTDALATIELSLFNQTNLSQTTTCSVNLEESSGGAYYLYFGNSTTSNPPPTIINAEMANIGDNLTGLLRMEYINDTETINCTFTTGFDSYSVKGVTKDIGQDFGAGILSQLTTQGGAASGDVNATIASFNYSLAPVASANNEPTSTILLNTTDLTANDTNQNLTAYSETSDLDNDDVFVVYNWLLNGSSVMVLNMPFLPNDNNESASTHNYALGDNGNNTGGASWNSTGGFDFNGSYEFDSIDDYLSLENSGQYEPTMNFSIEAWVYVKGSGNNGGQNGIVNKDGGFNDGFNFAIGDSSAPTVNFGTGDSGASDIETITELNLNEWTHVVASYNGSNTSIYINGALDFVGTRTGALAYSTGDLEIGRNRDTPPGQEGYFNGSIDNVRIWNITLTPEQISALYKNRTDLIVSQELSVGDNWTVDVTPNDGVLDGAINRSNDLLVLDVTAPAANNDPTSTILLNTTDLTKNDTNQNLTAYVDTSDLDADTVNVVYNWLLNGSSVMVLNMPFLPNDGNETASTHNYALGDNGNVTGATWNSTGGFDFNGSYEFDSVDDYISIRDRSEFELTSNITIEAWFYLKGNGSTGISGLLNKDGGFGNGFDIELGTDDLLNVAFNTGDFGSTTLETAANAISLNRWTHLVIMYNGSNTSIYIDGALNVVGTKTGALTYSTGDLEIGRAINSSGQEGYFNGSIDNVRIWNRTLTPEQISALYKNRTDLIVSQELNVGDNWTVDVTPNDGVLDGAINRSNDLLVLDIVAAAPSCGTLTSNTTLTEDINSTETCFTIGAHGITLDCDNYLINYSTEGSGNGIDNTGYHNVTIKDCRIEQYGNTGEAILWDDARSGKLINNTIITYTATSPAIFIPPNSNNTYITKNNLTTKDNSYALDVVGRDNNITNNTFLSTNSAGIRVVYAQGVKNLFKNNFIQGYPFGSIGIDVNNLNNTFLNNTIIMNSSSSWGVRITDGNYTHLENNTINVTGATSYGIYLSDSSERNSLINNLLETNSSDSFSIFDETDDNKINYMSYINASSKIEWVDNGSRSFLRNLTFNGTIGPNTNIYLGNGTVAVDTSAFDNGKINSTVNITFYGLDLEFADAVIKIHSFSTDGVTIDSSGSDCVGDSCEIISYTGGTLRFNSTSLGSLFANNSEDLTPPNVTILTPINTSNFSKTSSNQTFNVSINEANIYGVLFIFDNGSGVDFNITANNNSGYWAAPYNVSTLAEGTQTVRVSANDTAGNINSTQQVTITTDYTAPNVTIISPTNRSNYSFTSSNQTFNTSVFDANIKTVWFSFDNGTGTDFNITANNNSGYWAAPYNVSTLAEGTQTITIIANDSVGNVNTTQSVTITTDYTPPNVTWIAPTNTTNFSVTSSNQTFNVSVFDATAETVLFLFNNGSGNDFNISATNQSGFWTASYNVSTLAEGTQTIGIFANDSVGHVNNSQTTNITITTDYTAPNITILTPTNRSNYSFTSSNQTFNTSVFDANIKSVWFSFDNGTGADFNITANNNSGYWAAPYNVSTLAEGTQTVTIIANDSAGNVNTTQSITITTDYTPPNVTFNSPNNLSSFNIESSNTTFNVSIFDANIETVKFVFNNGTGADFNVTPQNQSGYWVASYNVSTLDTATQTVKVYANDSLGHLNYTVELTFTVSTDSVPPNVTWTTPINTSNFSKTSSNQTFNVSINEANVYGVLFIFDNGTGTEFNISATNQSGKWVTSYNVSSLDEATQTVRVSANDTSGNVNNTQKITITTDFTPPNVTWITPTNTSNFSIASSNQTFNTSIFDANIKTVWFSFDNGTGTDFNITANNNSGYWAAPYNVSSLAEGIQTIMIIANDSAGNVNTTQSITITTDYTIPVVNITFPTNGTNFSIGSYNQTFNVSIQERDIGMVLFNFDNSSGTGFNLTPTNQSGYWVASYNVSKLANGTHLLTILVNDTVNNKNNTQTINFTFDNRTMPVAPAPAGAGNTGSSGGGGSSSSSGGSAAPAAPSAPSPPSAPAPAKTPAKAPAKKASVSKSAVGKGDSVSAQKSKAGRKGIATGLALFQDLGTVTAKYSVYVIPFVGIILMMLGLSYAIPVARRRLRHKIQRETVMVHSPYVELEKEERKPIKQWGFHPDPLLEKEFEDLNTQIAHIRKDSEKVPFHARVSKGYELATKRVHKELEKIKGKTLPTSQPRILSQSEKHRELLQKMEEINAKIAKLKMAKGEKFKVISSAPKTSIKNKVKEKRIFQTISRKIRPRSMIEKYEITAARQVKRISKKVEKMTVANNELSSIDEEIAKVKRKLEQQKNKY